MGVYRHWADSQLYGWALDTVEEFKEYFDSTRSKGDFDRYVEGYKTGVYDKRLADLFEGNAVNFNLGGENDKSKLEFTDRPIGVFDFSLASQQLFRVHEFYSEQLHNEQPNLFDTYNVPSGVVPNYYVNKIVIQGINNFIYKDDKTNTEYICVRRQKGLTKLLQQQPNLQTKIQPGTGLIIPTIPTNKVTFASKTKKPYLKYKRQGGKVRYVEIYSAHYYTRMSDDFSFAVRHIPVLMAAEYLEKMGTLTKLYATRFVIAGSSPRPKKKDVLTGITLPLYDEWVRENQPYGNYTIMPMCVKEYGQEIDKPRFFAVASETFADLYESAVQNMRVHELQSGNLSAYGDPDWTEKEYQEGFERFRQKYALYSEKGIWKAKEVIPQGLIYFHDLPLNIKWDYFKRNAMDSFRSNNITELIKNEPSVNKWFEMWMKISAFTIKDKFDIFNSNNPSKTYREIIKQQQSIIQEIEFLIRVEKNTQFQNVLREFLEFVLYPLKYGYSGNIVSAGYSYSDPIKYITEKINEMTIFAGGGIFATPPEQIEKRNEIAEKLIEELTKI
jgi:hypothetical protein